MTTAAAPVQSLCYNCFAQRDTAKGPCPHCGFDLAENQAKFPVALPAGTVLNNRYIVGRVLGQGGFGITYVAFDTQLQARVAIKEYMPSDIATRVAGTTVSVMMDTKTDDFTYGSERFQEEAHTLAKFIGHPNIAGVSSYFDENDTSYFVMDYIEGVSFKNYIANNGGKISVDETLNVMIPVLRALTAVHAEGFIHRDVTPDNIYISKDGNVKLLDFGSARYSIGDKSKSLDVILKVGYAPKEQYIRRGRQGPYTDVYSCAACFYAALTGYLPPESLERLDHDELVPVSAVVPEIPEWLDKAILKGLAVQPEDRFQSAAEFLDTIENRLVVDVPVAGQTAPAQPAKKKTVPLLIAGIAAVLAVAIGLGALTGGRGGGDNRGGGRGENLLRAEVPYITIRGQQISTDETSLELSGQGLTDADVEELRYMVNLYSLQLDNNQLTRLPDLSGLPRLESLQVQGNNLTDISGIAGMTTLRYVGLGENPSLSDLSPLAGMTQLENVNYYNTAVSDYRFLEGMSSLKNVQINHLTADTDLSALSTLTGVEQLYLQPQDQNTPLPDLRFLAGMTGLQQLQIYGYMDSLDLPSLSGLTRLRQLNIQSSSEYFNGTLDLEFLRGLTALEELQINLNASNSIDLSPLSGLTGLRTLQLRGNVESLSPLSGLTGLRTLNIYNYGSGDYYPLTDVSGLANLSGLEELNLSLGDVRDFTPFQGLTGLKKLQLSGRYNPGDLSFLSGMTQLQELTLNGYNNFRVSDFSALSGLTGLTKLCMSVDGLLSFRGLEGMTQMRELQLYGSDAAYTELSPLSGMTELTSLQLPSRGNVTTPYTIDGIESMRKLTELRLESGIKDLAPLSQLTQLTSLSIAGGYMSEEGAFSDLTPLASLTRLTKLTLHLDYYVTDLSPLAALTGLQELQIDARYDYDNYRNPVRLKDISPIGALTNLQTLYLSEYGVTDISCLRNLERLQKVTIYEYGDYQGYKITDWSPIEHVPLIEGTYAQNR